METTTIIPTHASALAGCTSLSVTFDVSCGETASTIVIETDFDAASDTVHIKFRIKLCKRNHFLNGFHEFHESSKSISNNFAIDASSPAFMPIERTDQDGMRSADSANDSDLGGQRESCTSTAE